MKIPGVSFSLKRALGITQMKQKFARKTGIPTSKALMIANQKQWAEKVEKYLLLCPFIFIVD